MNTALKIDQDLFRRGQEVWLTRKGISKKVIFLEKISNFMSTVVNDQNRIEAVFSFELETREIDEAETDR
jgi:hypothetical protein